MSLLGLHRLLLAFVLTSHHHTRHSRLRLLKMIVLNLILLPCVLHFEQLSDELITQYFLFFRLFHFMQNFVQALADLPKICSNLMALNAKKRINLMDFNGKNEFRYFLQFINQH